MFDEQQLNCFNDYCWFPRNMKYRSASSVLKRLRFPNQNLQTMHFGHIFRSNLLISKETKGLESENSWLLESHCEINFARTMA